MTDMKNLISDEALDMVVGGAGTLYVMKVTDAAGNVVKYNAVGVEANISEAALSSLKSGSLSKLKADASLMVWDGVKASKWEKLLGKASALGFTNVQYLN